MIQKRIKEFSTLITIFVISFLIIVLIQDDLTNFLSKPTTLSIKFFSEQKTLLIIYHFYKKKFFSNNFFIKILN